jgi:hypothetical protein
MSRPNVCRPNVIRPNVIRPNDVLPAQTMKSYTPTACLPFPVWTIVLSIFKNQGKNWFETGFCNFVVEARDTSSYS